MTAAIRVVDLHHSYPDATVALNGVSLAVEAGERVAILGPNGAGKTTLMLHLNGLLLAQAGEVAINGLVVAKKTLRQIRSSIGFVFQDPDDQLFMPTVGKDVAFGPANYGVTGLELEARVDEALTAVGMADQKDRPPHLLSGGQRHRVALATVLAMKPEILVLDEPSANLDPRARREFGELVLSLGLTTVLVTHDLPYAFQLCERAVVLDNGAVVADQPMRDIMADRELLAKHRLELPFGFRVGPLA